MTLASNRDTALAQLEEIEIAKKAVSDALKADREAARDRGDLKTSRAITKTLRRLGQLHVRILNTRRQINAAASLSSATKRLQRLTKDAQEVKRDLDRTAKALKAFADIVKILNKLGDIFA